MGIAYPKTQIALSVLQREQGLEPSHLLFFRRHRSQALQTRFLMPSFESCEAVRCERDSLLAGEAGAAGDMLGLVARW